MAKGSHATWGHPDQPRVCAVCGKRCRITKDSLHLDTFRKLTFHTECEPRIVGAERR